MQKRSFDQNKIEDIERNRVVGEFFDHNSDLARWIAKLSLEYQYVLKEIIFLGQGPLVFAGFDEIKDKEKKLKALAQQLLQIESFYDSIGGLVGYHRTFMEMLEDKTESLSHMHIEYPPMFDIRKEKEALIEVVDIAIEHLPYLGAIFPVGGAGDRLGLIDEKTHEPLPAANLPFLGKSLFELLIRDLEAMESLYFKKYKKRIFIPIVCMTSEEKHNHQLIIELCEYKQWFHRSKEGFYFVKQLSVPVVTETGKWVMKGPLELFTKPNGHGALWKVMKDQNAFSWLENQGINKVFVRQVNNPLCATDTNLLAFIGLGIKHKKNFGFCSCPRKEGVSEGMDVLLEKRIDHYFDYCVANIEYTDFAKWNIEEMSQEKHGSFLQYPANTNILFGDLFSLKRAIQNCPLPGLIINMKTEVEEKDAKGKELMVKAGRLEGMMQAISECFFDRFEKKWEKKEGIALKTYLTYNERSKTISTTKKLYKEDMSIAETPEGALYDILKNAYELLTNYCNSSLPSFPDEKTYLEKGPSFLFLFHPALGPLYRIIAEKIQKLSFAFGSELQLDLTDGLFHSVAVDGSLLVRATNPLKEKTEPCRSFYPRKEGRCVLKNVRISNKGIDRSADNIFWKNEIKRKEALEIELQGCSEFIAENVHFKGGKKIVVPDRHRMTALQKEKSITYRLEKISS